MPKLPYGWFCERFGKRGNKVELWHVFHLGTFLACGPTRYKAIRNACKEVGITNLKKYANNR